MRNRLRPSGVAAEPGGPRTAGAVAALGRAGRGGATPEPRVPLPWPPPAPCAAPSPPGRAPGPRTDGPWRRPPPASPCSPPPRSRWRPGPRPAPASAPDPVSERAPASAPRRARPRGDAGRPAWGGPNPLAPTSRDSFSQPLSDAPRPGRSPALKPGASPHPQPLSDAPGARAPSLPQDLLLGSFSQAPKRRLLGWDVSSARGPATPLLKFLSDSARVGMPPLPQHVPGSCPVYQRRTSPRDATPSPQAPQLLPRARIPSANPTTTPPRLSAQERARRRAQRAPSLSAPFPAAPACRTL